MIDDPLNRTKVRRGSQLPWAKLDEDDVRTIHQLVEHRDDLKRQASELSNAKIAEKYGVHVRTIEKITQGLGWTHVMVGEKNVNR